MKRGENTIFKNGGNQVKNLNIGVGAPYVRILTFHLGRIAPLGSFDAFGICEELCMSQLMLYNHTYNSRAY